MHLCYPTLLQCFMYLSKALFFLYSFSLECSQSIFFLFLKWVCLNWTCTEVPFLHFTRSSDLARIPNWASTSLVTRCVFGFSLHVCRFVQNSLRSVHYAFFQSSAKLLSDSTLHSVILAVELVWLWKKFPLIRTFFFRPKELVIVRRKPE